MTQLESIFMYCWNIPFFSSTLNWDLLSFFVCSLIKIQIIAPTNLILNITVFAICASFKKKHITLALRSSSEILFYKGFLNMEVLVLVASCHSEKLTDSLVQKFLYWSCIFKLNENYTIVMNYSDWTIWMRDNRWHRLWM